ncbi:MAG: stage II sporulation protein R [Eubacteriales bacterium]
MKNSTHSARAYRFAAFLTCAILLASLIALLALSLKQDDFNTDPVYSSVFRLHIRANSNSDEDQATKLAVRDALLPFTARLFAECQDLDDAVRVANAENAAILDHINATLHGLGADYSARISVGREEFPERDYGGAVYPAGEYTALIVELGTGEGDNWWCVLFPSLCLSPAVKDEDVEVGLTPEQFEAITAPDDTPTAAPAPKYRLKFKFWELILSLFDD